MSHIPQSFKRTTLWGKGAKNRGSDTHIHAHIIIILYVIYPQTCNNYSCNLS